MIYISILNKHGIYRNFSNLILFSLIMSKKRQMENNEQQSENKKKRVANNHWSLGLINAMGDPDLLIESDELVVVIKDKYPKAKYHFLVIPKENISNLKKLTDEHVALLKHMEKAGKKVIEKLKLEEHTFKFGYHSEPSMERLHLHVISDDMHSPCLKTKKHWNSYVSDFFLDSKAVRADLKKNHSVTLLPSSKVKELLNTPLSCHKCDYKPKHLPDLKTHIIDHMK